MIKNLNQLRRTLREGTQLEILDHCRPECIGQIRNITLVNTQGFYSTVQTLTSLCICLPYEEQV